MKIVDKLNKIYSSRYFWFHLAKSDIRSRYRRSKLGLLWMFVQPLLFSAILAFVFGTIFNQPMGEYSLYVVSGIVVWNLANASVINGGFCLSQAEQYIRQFNHPKIIYSLRASLVSIYTFLIEFIALIIWMVIKKPENLLLGMISLPLTTVLYFFLSWSLTTIAGYLNVKYRDYPQVMGLLMQALYFVSPVFIKQDLFMSSEKLRLYTQINPVTHILNLVREPFLYGRFAETISYFYVLGLIMFFFIIATIIEAKNEKKVIFYL